jgi:hypothetical protein
MHSTALFYCMPDLHLAREVATEVKTPEIIDCWCIRRPGFLSDLLKGCLERVRVRIKPPTSGFASD